MVEEASAFIFFRLANAVLAVQTWPPRSSLSERLKKNDERAEETLGIVSETRWNGRNDIKNDALSMAGAIYRE